jgi:hypothetical protein
MKFFQEPRMVMIAIALSLFSAIAFAQTSTDSMDVVARFTWIPNSHPVSASATSLPEWNGSFVYQGKDLKTTYNFSMVGTAPATGSSTTVTTVIVPLKLVVSGQTFDPAAIPANTGGLSAIQNTVQSPLFDMTTTYVQGGTNVGTTQYIDAYQRANFWGTVQNNLGYHLLLSPVPTVLNTVTLTVPAAKGKIASPYGESVAEVDINYMDAQINSLITQLGIQPDQLPIFMTYKTYLMDSGCCIGGYHSATGAQSYMHFTYIDLAGKFAQDVSALSHEIGEWADDPLINQPNGNRTRCGILENGDPLESLPNFGGVPYVLHGFTYNLQDLVTLPYFGAPPSTSVNNFFTFQGKVLKVCQNGA